LLLFALGFGPAGLAGDWVDLSSNKNQSGSDPRYLARRLVKDGIISFLDIKNPSKDFIVRHAYNCMKKQTKIAAIHKGSLLSLKETIDNWRGIEAGSVEDVRWRYACLGQKP
jgi:hypothetical protein